MRRRAPDVPRPFRAPLGWVVGLGAVCGCLYLFASLPTKTILWCFGWNAIGLLVYFLYSRPRAVLGR